VKTHGAAPNLSLLTVFAAERCRSSDRMDWENGGRVLYTGVRENRAANESVAQSRPGPSGELLARVGERRAIGWGWERTDKWAPRCQREKREKVHAAETDAWALCARCARYKRDGPASVFQPIRLRELFFFFSLFVLVPIITFKFKFELGSSLTQTSKMYHISTSTCVCRNVSFIIISLQFSLIF
jgi:hypothetical protein